MKRCTAPGWRHGGPRRRRGLTMTEVLAATLLVGAIGIVCLTMAATGTAVRRQQLTRQTALLEAENILQRLAALDPRELTLPLDRRQLLPALQQQLENRLQERLPGARLDIDVRPMDAPLSGQSITVAIELPARSPATGAVVRLSTWIYSASEAPP